MEKNNLNNGKNEKNNNILGDKINRNNDKNINDLINDGIQTSKTNKANTTKSGLDEKVLIKNSIKTETDKKAEIETGETKKADNLTRNIFICLIVFMISFVSIASVAITGGFSKPEAVIQANVANTRIVQAKLAELGYFNSEIDGIYDDETIDAIKKYQQDNNITASGILDSSTSVALGVTDNTQANSDLYLLAKLVHSEARGEPYEGQVAVAAVVLNRVDDAGFPNTLQGVIYQPWAFTALHDGQFSLEPNATAYDAAQDALNGWDPTYGCLYYYNPVTATSSWIFSREIIVTIGRHVFCI